MTDAATHQILTDLVHWLLVSLPLALLVYGWQRGTAGPAEGPGPFPPPPGIPADAVDLVVALGFVLAMRWHVTAAPAPAEAPEIGLSGVLADMGIKCLLILLLLAFVRGVRGRSLSQWFGLGPSRPGRFALQAVCWAVTGAGLAYFSNEIVTGFVLDPLGFEPDAQEAVRAFEEAPGWLLRVVLTLSACVLAPVVEETLFRGFLYPVLRAFTDAPFAAVFTGVLFGLVHRNLHGTVPLAILGVVLAVAYERARGIGLPIAIHALFNTASIILMWLAPAS